jgi:uncharacterized protein (DUF433 family)
MGFGGDSMTREEMAKLLERVVVDPDVQGGRPVIRGARVPVSRIVGALSAGADHVELCEDYGITEYDVRVALAYAARAAEFDDDR